MKMASTCVTLVGISFAVPALGQVDISESRTELVVSSPTPTKFQPDEKDIDEAISAFDMFLNFVDVGKLREAYAMLTNTNQQLTKWADWEQMQSSAQQQFGVDLTRHVVRMTWYPDPPSADQKGLFVALDFASEMQKNGFRCGYVVLLKNPTAPWQVARTDFSNVPRALTDKQLPSADIVSKLPCYLGKDVATSFPNVIK